MRRMEDCPQRMSHAMRQGGHRIPKAKPGNRCRVLHVLARLEIRTVFPGARQVLESIERPSGINHP